MNTILQKRIEEAAHQYIQSDAVAPENMQLAFGDFINGAKFALQNQWISVEEALPDFQQSVVVTNSKGDYWAAWRLNDNCEDTDDNGFVNNGIGEITHWMMIPTINNEEK